MKIELQSQSCKYHMYEELIEVPALVTLKTPTIQEKYTYNQISFCHFLQQNIIKSWKEQLLRNFFCIFIISQMFISQEKFVHLHANHYYFLQETTKKTSIKKTTNNKTLFYIVLQVVWHYYTKKVYASKYIHLGNISFCNRLS